MIHICSYQGTIGAMTTMRMKHKSIVMKTWKALSVAWMQNPSSISLSSNDMTLRTASSVSPIGVIFIWISISSLSFSKSSGSPHNVCFNACRKSNVKSSLLDGEEDDELLESVSLSSHGSFDLSHPSVDGDTIDISHKIWISLNFLKC